MALTVVKGIIASPGATGNQTINATSNTELSGFGTIKAIVLWMNGLTGEGSAGQSALLTIGFGTYRGATPQQYCANIFSTDPGANSDTACGTSAADILRGYSAATPTVDIQVTLVSLGDAEIVLNWVNLGTGTDDVHYMALGGSDLTDALVHTFDYLTTGATQDVTVVAGFGKPNTVLFLGGNPGTVDADTAGEAMLFIGAGNDLAEERVSSWGEGDASATMALAFVQRSDVIVRASGATIEMSASLSAVGSWPTDGYQLAKATNPAAAVRVGALALKGTFKSVIGATTVPTAAPTVNTDLAVGATPRGAFFFHLNLPVIAGVDSTDASLGMIGIGGMDGTREGWMGMGQDDANTTSVTWQAISNTKSIRMYTPSAAGTLTSEADGSFSGNNVRLAWADTDTVAREYNYLLFGDGVSLVLPPPSLIVRDAVNRSYTY